YALLAGAPPFSGPEYDTTDRKMLAHLNAPALPIPQLPPRLTATLQRLLAKDPGSRFATAAEAAQALRPFTTKPHLGRQRPALALVALTLLLGVGGALLLLPRPPERAGPERAAGQKEGGGGRDAANPHSFLGIALKPKDGRIWAVIKDSPAAKAGL